MNAPSPAAAPASAHLRKPASGAPLRIAMWSGPRNISTAMMRAWENRGDCAVSDEPLYAAYLAATGLDHPMREQVIAAGDTDPQRVIAALLGPTPDGKSIWYQKHMAHHLLPGMDCGWIASLHNVLLIRDPREVVASYLKARDTVTPEEIGLLQQVALYEQLASAGKAPLVIEAREFLADPAAHLHALCAHLDIAFTPRMLHWPTGPRESDGVWAPHWYAQVWQSSGFDPPRQPATVMLPAHGEAVVAACQPAYRRLHALRMRASSAA